MGTPAGCTSHLRAPSLTPARWAGANAEARPLDRHRGRCGRARPRVPPRHAAASFSFLAISAWYAFTSA